MLVFPDRSIAWDVSTPENLRLEDLAPVLDIADHIEILIIGCGPTFGPVPSGLREVLRQHRIVLEWMDTGAACRTYNVLLAEERRLAAALIAV